MATRSDNFNRSNGALGTPSDGGSAWEDVGPKFNIISNAAGNVTSGVPDVCFLDCGEADGTAQITLTVKAGGSYFGLLVRAADANNYICFRANPSNYEIFSVIAGSVGNATAGGSTPANGDVMSVVLSGTSITGKVNGTNVVGPVTISSLTSNTRCGLYAYADTASRFDDFSWAGAASGSTGTAAGAATVSAAGKSTAATTATAAAGVATVSAIGKSVAATTATAAAGVATVSGVGAFAALASLVSSVFKNNTGTVYASLTNVTAWVYALVTGVLVVKKSTQVTDGSGVLTVSDASLTAATDYRVVYRNETDGAEGMETLTAS